MLLEKNFSSRSREIDIWQGHDTGLLETFHLLLGVLVHVFLQATETSWPLKDGIAFAY